MEQHPIPRDVTGFQFKLVGSMTLKQFGYVAGGAIIGYIFFKSPLGIFRLPLTALFWFLGFALAFIPIQERPLECWLKAFIKSVYSPTQFVWKKTPPEIEILARPHLAPKKGKVLPLPQYEESRKKLEKYLNTLPLPLEDQLDQKEREVLSKALSLFKTPPPTPAPSFPPPQPQPPKKTFPKKEPISPPPQKVKPIIPPPLKVKTSKEKEKRKEKPAVKDQLLKERQLKEEIEALRKNLALKDLSRARFLELSSQLTQALEEKRRLEETLASLRKRAEEKEKEVVTPTQEVLEEEKPRVKIITPQLAPKMGIPNIPQAPNIISGIIKDSQERLLPGIIITVKDKNEMTVRALKTNNLGLFVSATSLPSGIYTLEIEDPKKKFKFDIIKVTLKGEVYSPLEILAKGEREQLREGLTRELFGKSS